MRVDHPRAVAFGVFAVLAVVVTASRPRALQTGHAGAVQSDPKIGKWRLRVDPPARGTREYDDRGCGVTVSVRQGVNARGQEYYSSYAVKVDAKEYPRFVRGSTAVNSIAFSQVDADTVAFTLRENGVVTSTGTTSVSKDGNVLTVTTKSVSSSGPGTKEIYDRLP